MAAIARLRVVALDCPDALALAEFYVQITGWSISEETNPDDPPGEWVELSSPQGATLAFQRVEDFQPPVWPGSQHPQQLHLDFEVPDLDAGEAALLAIGARKADTQPMPGSFRVYLDPVGHPFCLVLRTDMTLD
jgi:catechol 2,3-dioxygenase-like lactoylglutathione lyase family enzyme